MILAALTSLAFVFLYAWQDWKGYTPNWCSDGARYTSGKPQPTPFHRRFCGWPKSVLTVASLGSLLALGVMMGDWKHAALLLALPGAWFITTHPTTVDAPAMLLAWVAGLLFPTHPWASVLLSCLAGFIHERGPVFAAIYAWHPLLLVGLVAVGWWRTPAKKPGALVGGGFLQAIKAHKPYQDWLDMRLTAYATRMVVPLAAFYSVPPKAWLALVVAWGSRLVGTDSARFIFWGAPLVIHELPDVPLWALALHVLTFRRMI